MGSDDVWLDDEAKATYYDPLAAAIAGDNAMKEAERAGADRLAARPWWRKIRLRRKRCPHTFIGTVPPRRILRCSACGQRFGRSKVKLSNG